MRTEIKKAYKFSKIYVGKYETLTVHYVVEHIVVEETKEEYLGISGAINREPLEGWDIKNPLDQNFQKKLVDYLKDQCDKLVETKMLDKFREHDTIGARFYLNLPTFELGS